jgi:type I restriction enzyme, R subunit
MNRPSEQALENQLIEQLNELGYSKVRIRNEHELTGNLRRQLEKHNGLRWSDTEFDRVLNILSKGSVFEKSKTLRERQHILRDNGDNCYFVFLNTEHWCQNEFQVTNQVEIDGKYKNRYDVTLLINGLPLVQIELKRTGIELKEAFNQVNRYQSHSFGSGFGLYQYVQIFIISNGVNTKYFANNKHQNFKQTFYWADKENRRMTNILNGFTSEFLEPCHLSKMICKYIVLNETSKVPMVLRPYQYYAVEALIDRVKNSNKNGYIWHTTGSGKTLTSFKASQILTQMPEIVKVVFVVDRKDLDHQTVREFNSFSQGSIDATDNTLALVAKLSGSDKLIVTTIQKLNNAIVSARFTDRMAHLKTAKTVFIFDECHRSQFGETHARIRAFFSNAQLFGFTGTPIFVENAMTNTLGQRTTKDLFADCLHKYVITDAIRDENVLRFSVEYIGKYVDKLDRATAIDIEVEAIDTEELMQSPQRLGKIAEYIIANHQRKTHGKNFTSIFCVSSIEVLTQYYDLLYSKKQAGEHSLSVATIFSFAANEEDAAATGFAPEEELSMAAEPAVLYGAAARSRDKLETYIGHYNEQFGTQFSTRNEGGFYTYNNDISTKVRAGQIDVLLVVNMFLTGFDSLRLNTLYVDKNLKYHGLIQAFSRTNRIASDLKTHGNIVVFRNLKERTDEAITLFSNKEAIEQVVMKPYEDYVAMFNQAVAHLLGLTPTVDSVNDLVSEDDELAFVRAFRALMRIMSILKSFSDFTWDDCDMSEGLFFEFQSKYLDLYEKGKNAVNTPEKVSILGEVDFELELIHKDDINVRYILMLLMKLKESIQQDAEKLDREIKELLNNEPQLRSKRELIEKFIAENMPKIDGAEKVNDAFDSFWSREQRKAFKQLVADENLSPVRTERLIEDMVYTQRDPIAEEVLSLLESGQPRILERRPISERIMAKLKGFLDTFLEGMG